MRLVKLVSKVSKSISSFDRKNNSDKDRYNKIVCDAMIIQQARTVLMCDGLHMRSTKACEAIGIKRHNITTLEYKPSLSTSHRKRGVYSFNMKAEDMLSRPNRYKPYDTINLDVVSAPKTISKYIGNIFASRYLSNKSVLAITVTKRTGKSGGSFNPQFQDLQEKIQTFSKAYGYNLKIHSTHSQEKVESLIYLVNRI